MLLTDGHLPSLVSEIAGSPPKGSWWAHPASHLIYHIAERLEESPGVLALPLLKGKVTFVHRRLWPEILSVATSRESWQREGLTGAESSLLALVERRGRLNVQRDVEGLPLHRTETIGDIARGLEHRLLVYGASVHSPMGRHEKELQTWASWKRERRFRSGVVLPVAARSTLQRAATACLGPVLPLRMFPWDRYDRRR